MKTLHLAILGTAIVLTSCSSSKQTAYSEYDDVYYNPKKAEKAEKQASIVEELEVVPEQIVVAAPMVQEQAYTTAQVYQDENLSDYEKYKMQQEAEMLGETYYEPQGSEALYVDQFQ